VFGSGKHLFAFEHFSVLAPERESGWSLYDPEREFTRMVWCQFFFFLFFLSLFPRKNPPQLT
jgi:hypothetical protein